MFNFDNATKVTKANSRANYDIRYSAKTDNFTISQNIYDKYDIANNGFNILKDGTTVALEVVPNDEATLHTGREGSTKGLIFKAKAIVNIMNLSSTTMFTLQEQTHNGSTFLVMVNDDKTPQGDTTSEESENEEAVNGSEYAEPEDSIFG